MIEVIGYITSPITVQIICPHCRRIHTHGREVEGKIGYLGHRHAHCADGNHNEGYIIASVMPLSEFPLLKTRKARR